ncbi:flagellar biosynthetic protein FliR [Neorhizobium huautlense]|uniref:Flagellar biosynthetic protein FliR n=2 Tax=Neorhizobium huautlense TaxID=67774 RepID=A0ABT9PTE3_9HYPH|nr:flagellar biosynthetic protein FliR [Neorhizobium huautlense]
MTACAAGKSRAKTVIKEVTMFSGPIDAQGIILTLFLCFCRMGACIMVMPGFSSARIPLQVRLLVAIAIAMAIMPVLWDTIYPRVANPGPIYVGLVFSEALVGVIYGLIARIYVIGMQFAGTIISLSIGFNAPGGSDILEDFPENQLINLLSFGALMVLFLLDFHHIMFRALVDSYGVTPVGALIEPQKMLITLTDTLRASTMIMLRLAGPFLLFGMMFNIAIGLVNKLAPQVPVSFISAPFLLFGGLFLLYLSIGAMIRQFADGFVPVFTSF